MPNPIWHSIPGLPDSISSGVQPADILYWVRREAWHSEAVERANTSVRQASTRRNSGNPQALKFQLTEHMEEVGEVAKEKPFKDTWSPLHG